MPAISIPTMARALLLSPPCCVRRRLRADRRVRAFDIFCRKETRCIHCKEGILALHMQTTSPPAFISATQLSRLLYPERNQDLVLLTTLARPDDCDFLIEGTIEAHREVEFVRRLAVSPAGRLRTHIVIYGTSEEDLPVLQAKQSALRRLQFQNIYIFLGGLFRWLAMRFFYEPRQFPCTITARARAELGAPPSEGGGGGTDLAGAEAARKSDAYHRILGLRLLHPTDDPHPDHK